jgi:hypothetical protein
VLLPENGRVGDLPAWPISPEPNAAEVVMWQHLWTLPQAIEWERAWLFDVIARYVRIRVAADQRYAKPTIVSEARQLEDRLGLTPMSMLRLGWKLSAAVGAGSEGISDIRELSLRERVKTVMSREDAKQ